MPGFGRPILGFRPPLNVADGGPTTRSLSQESRFGEMPAPHQIGGTRATCGAVIDALGTANREGSHKGCPYTECVL